MHSPMPASAGPVLGVLGGMGPAATADFLHKLASATAAGRDQDHIPTLVYSDPTTPDRSNAILEEGPDPLPSLLHGVDFLCKAGVSAIAIPCNTAHHWFEEVAHHATVPVLNMVDETAIRILRDRPTIKSVGLMSTDGTALSGVYKRLEQFGIQTLDLTDLGATNPVMSGIRLVKSGDLEAARGVLETAEQLLLERGAEGVVYGCTDVSAALGGSEPYAPVPAWDSSESLARGAVQFMQSLQPASEF